MCRMLGYLGPPITLQWLLFDPPHSLHEQAWAPEQQLAGVLNADGFGVGWYDFERRPEPARYRTTKPMWADHSFISIAGVVRSTAVVAAVRGTTPPSLNEESSTPPFISGRWLFAHNGKVEGFRDGVASRLRRGLSERRDAGVFGTSDSEVLFAMALDRLDAGISPADALADVVKTVDEQNGGTLTMLLTDGESLAATAAGNSLSVLGGAHFVVLASEPFDDDPSWAPVPDRSVVTAVPGDVRCEAL
jgi:glutamine amidotransferase